MHSKFPLKTAHLSSSQPFPSISTHYKRFLRYQTASKIICSDRNSSSSSSSSDKKFQLKLLGQNLADSIWKINDIDANALQETLNLWMSKTHNFLSKVASPLIKNVHEIKLTEGNASDSQDVEEIFVTEQTVDSTTPNGILSLAAIVSIEQFSRLNGLTGQKMQRIFKSLVPESVYIDARNLVEYCCFRFLARDSSDVHPSLKEPAFQRLIFITMLAWEHPYSDGKDSQVNTPGRSFLKKRFIGEEAFVRIAPAISGVADWSTAHNLFKALSGDEEGISFSLWCTYINELLKVHEGRKLCQFEEWPNLSSERILCLGSSRKRPVLKWKNNMAWPGKLTLTDRALYFEAVGLVGEQDGIRLDLTKDGAHVEKARVGPLGSNFFDSAVSVMSSPECESWILEFVDLGGEMRRDVWHAFIGEVIALHKFIREFGPYDGDQTLYNVYGAQKGSDKATTYAVNGIARLQALQFVRKLLGEPTKLVQFSYLQTAPYGDVVCQTLAVNCWGGPLITRFTESEPDQGARSSDAYSESSNYVFDVDGSVYLRKWMRSLSWTSSSSVMFWKNASAMKGLVLSKNLVIADMNLVEKAAITCRIKYRVVEKTQATIDDARIEGIPSNIDLFKELVLPLTISAKNFEKLRCWEEPNLTASFLAFVYTLIFRNLLSYVFPMTLMIMAIVMLLLKGLKGQGRLGRFFGKVTIREQPPSNTIQKIVAVKEAMHEVEKYLQNLNVSLLKVRSIVLAGQPQITIEVALVLLLSSTILLVVPFKYVIACLVFDLFTRDLKFRRHMSLKFMSFLKERWDTVPAAPVVVLPFEVDDVRAENRRKEINDGKKRGEINDGVKSERTHNSSRSQ